MKFGLLCLCIGVFCQIATSQVHFGVKGGMNVATLVGYRINPGKYNISISAGYKWQSNSYTIGYEWFGGPATEVDESLERVVIQIGVGLH